ncbi:hypothetical protein RO3G_02842 [Rhizopus delemar RA 99-880]|uniref:Uncharacterized protein n=1 Tax=Rhizopus delemar (strain RA 99-880 / ATCC MYA-4621 / FGSC 9543 / NRRL 43880) TaxID=246409 RepID=I1BPK8_RHIO9|nr:hypothetical protein RO3G_02842 [Rhizopus delemar RA 99-880]|eukprot:EIE78138.1 hypothetical protein RO3G_02842 [Rhizopus delemar RA 99-880]
MRKENRRYRPSIPIFVDNRLRKCHCKSDENDTSAPSTAVKKLRTA